jgi:SagB-type dehydrogenase family enzyme
MAIPIGQHFIRDTYYDRLSPPDQAQGVPQPPLYRATDAPPENRIALPDPTGLGMEIPLTQAMAQRESLRAYAATSLSLEELSYLLWSTQGVRREIPGKATFRTVPSAGARHPLETYLLIHRVIDVSPGLYAYDPQEHAIESRETAEEISAHVTAACLGQEIVTASAVTFLWTAIPYRASWRYGERAYRYVFLDVGHVAQNLYLAAEAIGAGACAIGAFADAELNEALGVDGVSEFALYAASVGKRDS